MSISIGFISKSFGIIACDSRMFASAEIDLITGEILKLAKIENDEFDKTFSIDKKIIGGYTGLMEIENMSISKIIEGIYQKECASIDDNEKVINSIGVSLKNKLNSLDEKYVSKKLIKLDILIIASSSIHKIPFTIHFLGFRPDSNNLIVLNIESKPKERINKNLVDWWIIGDDNAQYETSKFIQDSIKNNQNNNFQFIRSLAYKAIRHGIKCSGQHPYGLENTCGGSVNVKCLK